MAAGIKVLVHGQGKSIWSCRLCSPWHRHCRMMCLSPAGALWALGHSWAWEKTALSCTQQQKFSAKEGNLPELGVALDAHVACEMNFRQLTPKEDFADCNPYICPGAGTVIAKCLTDKAGLSPACPFATQPQRKYSPFVNKILKFRTKNTIGQFWRWL